jgi:hypothetical protein
VRDVPVWTAGSDLGIKLIDLLEALAIHRSSVFRELTVLRQISVRHVARGFTRLVSCFSFSYQDV